MLMRSDSGDYLEVSTLLVISMFETFPEIGDTRHEGPHGRPQDTAIYLLSLIDNAEGYGPMMRQNTSILSVLY